MLQVAPVPSHEASSRLDDVVLHPPSHYQRACKPARELWANGGDVLESISCIGGSSGYQLAYRLGSGGMGSVYKARHLNGDVAIKIGD